MVVKLSGTQPQGPKHLETLENKTVDGTQNTVRVNRGTSANRPVGAIIGDLYYNTEIKDLEQYTEDGWMIVAKQVPRVPTIGSATLQAENNVSVLFNPSQYGQPASSYIAQSNPGSYTTTGSSSPIIFPGTNLEIGTAYTFRVKSIGSYGDSAYSAYTSSVTPISLSSYESISTVNVTSASVPSITFSNIPQTYKHLQVRMFARSTRSYTGNGVDGIDIQANGSYPTYGHQLYGDGSSAATDTVNVLYLVPDDGGINPDIYGVGIIDILDYSSSSKNKTYKGFVGFDNAGSSPGFRGVVYLNSGFWNSTSAITSLTFAAAYGGNIKQYSQFALYGIRGE